MSKRFSNTPSVNKEKAIKKIQDFINAKFNGKFEDFKKQLPNFSFWEIDNDEDFGNGLSYSDGDRTQLAYAIDYLLFYEKLKDIDFQIYGYSTKESTYSGETLNTFNTLFSSNEDGRTELASVYESKYGLGAFKKDCYNPDGEVDNKDFYHVYQRLGNFSLLPCLTICGGSINTWKGMDASIRDYLYPFLIHLRKAYPLFSQRININSGETEEFELLLLMERNDFFFKKIDTFDKFISLFMLEGWEELELKKYLKNSEINVDNIEIVNDYINKATNFIVKRTNTMVDKLINILVDSKRG